ncbi:MAG: hypothetical protein AAF939_17925 [Planctomycetota bacterium]
MDQDNPFRPPAEILKDPLPPFQSEDHLSEDQSTFRKTTQLGCLLLGLGGFTFAVGTSHPFIGFLCGGTILAGVLILIIGLVDRDPRGSERN